MTANRKDLKLSFTESEMISVGKRTAAWLSPAAMYSVVPAGTKVSEFALGRWEGCNLMHDICLSRARFCMPQGCDGVQLVALSIGPLCRHDITRSD